MPGRDGNGPMGTGPNGRGFGPCGTEKRSFFGNWGMRRGWRGLGSFRNVPITSTEEEEMLNQQKSWIETRLEALKNIKK